ncbi:MAG TPA: sulfur carrier protein ThiS [Bacteroidales bacterium]|nr:sulfur carrier protein ThiS [Bacteroidales bacterium]
MKFILNNREEELNGESLSVNEMLTIKKFSYKLRIIKINGELISKEMYDSTIIHEGDNVQMFYLMSGG